jgi:putative transposase
MSCITWPATPHRVAISNHRLLNVTDDDVTFRWKDYAHRSKSRAMTLSHEEFLRRFLQHVLPTGFPRIRYFGFLANRRRSLLLPLCRNLLDASPASVATSTAATSAHSCPRCQAPMRIIERFTAFELQREHHRLVAALDSS